MENEVWKDIIGYENYYQISNLGRVKSLKRIIIRTDNKPYLQKETILKIAHNRKGYCHVHLTKNFISKTKSVHRLVAEAFIPNLENKPQVNHIDGNKENNNVNNLEWCDNLYNMQHSIKIGLRNNAREKIKESNYTEVDQYDLNGNFIKRWRCIKDIEKELNICNQNICKVCQGKRKKTGGYIWKYVNINNLKKCKFKTKMKEKGFKE